MTQSRTTVVIATRNRGEELAATVDRLLALRPQPPIVVVDNASSDDTAEVARQAGVRVIRLPRNQAAAARSVGVWVAGTRYVAFSDDDSWWAPDALPMAEKLFDEHPSLGAIAARPLVEPGARQDPINEAMAASPLGRDPGLPGPSVLGFLACALVVRREAYLDAGGFNPLLHFGAEEKLLAMDLVSWGWSLCYCAEVTAHHQPSSLRPSPGHRARLTKRNDVLIACMRRPVGYVVRAVSGLAKAATRSPVDRRALADVLRLLPAALRQRDPVPATVERRLRILERAW